MNKYVLLIKFTEKGAAAVQQSPDRKEAFRTALQKSGGKVELALWTMGPYDGILVAEAPDDATIAAITLAAGRHGNVTTCTMRAFDAAEFKQILAKMG